MGHSLGIRRAGPPLTQHSRKRPDLRFISPPLRLRPCSATLSLLAAAFLVLQAGGVESAGGAGRAAASTALFLTALTTSIDLSKQLTCYTCVNVTDNQVCNRYAIDRPCPEDKQFCHSLHVLEGFGSKGDSLLVNKGCAGDDECNRMSVGCRREGGQTTCNACCDYEYCNEKAPVDAETATLVRTRSLGSALVVPSHLAVLLFAFGPIASRLFESVRDFVECS